MLSKIKRADLTLSEAGFLTWLSARDAFLSKYNAPHEVGAPPAEHFLAAAREIEERIMETPAASRDDLLAKALLVIDMEANGRSDTDATRVFAEAKAWGLIAWEA